MWLGECSGETACDKAARLLCLAGDAWGWLLLLTYALFAVSVSELSFGGAYILKHWSLAVIVIHTAPGSS